MNAQAAQTPSPGTATFNITVRGQRTGQETVTLSRTDTGWLISASGSQQGQTPFIIDKFEARYSTDWQPQSLTLEAQSGTLMTMTTTFAGTSGTSDVLQGGQRNTLTQTISPRTVVLPNNFFSAYEALAARLATSAVGDTLPVYVAPQAEITGTVSGITTQRLQTPDAIVDLRHFNLLMRNPSGGISIDVSVDAKGRLARIGVPTAGIVVLRDDLSNVMTRDVTYSNDADAPAFIKALGFTIAATVTTPPVAAAAPATPTRKPAIILVSGLSTADRDETIAGIPIFGQLSAQLAKAGYVVVRYDKRGIGQSGGRPESITLHDYAEDVLSIISWLRDRKDIDDKRIAVVGFGEGGAVSLYAGDRAGGKIAALALVNAPGQTGREIVLAQQQHVLDRSNDSADEKRAKIALQTKILDAVVKGEGWTGVPVALQRAADTPMFKSWAEFDPVRAMKEADQPMLIVHGALDTEMAPVNADRLDTLARARKTKAAPLTKKVVVPGINHLLVPAKTGESSEYASLAGSAIAPEVASAIIEWLSTVMAPKK